MSNLHAQPVAALVANTVNAISKPSKSPFRNGHSYGHHHRRIEALSNIFSTTLVRLTEKQKLIILAIAEYSNGDTAKCWPSKRCIAAALGVCHKTVQRAVERFVKTGLMLARYRGDRHEYTFLDLGIHNLSKQAGALKAKREKRPTTNSEKCPTNNPHYVREVLENTASAEGSQASIESPKAEKLQAVQVRVNAIIEGNEKHMANLRRKAAYNRAVYDKQVQRGERYSREEEARRKAIAERNRPEREAAVKALGSKEAAMQSLLTWGAFLMSSTAEGIQRAKAKAKDLMIDSAMSILSKYPLGSVDALQYRKAQNWISTNGLQA